MKTFIWCLRRELWEHWGLLLGLPVIVGLLATAFIVAQFYSQFTGVIMLLSAAPAADRAAFTLAILVSKLETLTTMLFALGASILFYGSATLHEDRRDRSNLFWKSLPLSDTKMVVAKAVIVLVIAPIFTLACSLGVIGLSLLAAGEIAAFFGLNAFPVLFGSTALYGLIIKAVALWPIFVLTTLPALGWMFAISSLVKHRPLLWIAGLPIATTIPMGFMQTLGQRDGSLILITEDIGMRLLLGVVPGGWIHLRPSLSVDVSKEQTRFSGISQYILEGWQLTTLAGYWAAAAIGLALICSAIRLRRWRVET